MKRTLILIISVVLIICAILLSKYYTYREEKNETIKFNSKYEKYLDKDLLGTDVATLINLAFDDNKQKSYIKDENLVNIEIKITEFEKEQIYTMQILYNGGISEFVKYYGQIHFKCSKKEYNSEGQIEYILFEQIV